MKRLIESLQFKYRQIQLKRTAPIRDARRALYLVTKRLYNDNFSALGISIVKIEANSKRVNYTIYLRRPGLLIGKGGKYIDILYDELVNRLNKEVNIYIKEYSWYD